MAEHGITIEGSVDAWSQEQMKQYIEDNNICCPSCGKHDFTDIRQFKRIMGTEAAEQIEWLKKQLEDIGYTVAVARGDSPMLKEKNH